MPSINITHPEVAAQWHPTLNGELKPSDVTAGSHKVAVFICPNITCNNLCEHIWSSIISNRCRLGQGCPYCSTPPKKICSCNSIAVTHPEIAAQWHPTLNGKLTPHDVSFGSEKKAFFLCQNTCPYGCKHEWESNIGNRCRLDRGCPYCSNPIKKMCIHMSIKYTHPEIAMQLHPTRNEKIIVSDILSGSGYRAWWKCSINPEHEWQSAIYSRCGNNNGCPHCVNKTEAKLLEYLKQWYPDTQPQFRPTWCKSPATERKLPFDFYIPSLKLLIELDGAQHFRQVSNWSAPENTQKKDVYKMKQAFRNGLSVIRLLQEEVLNATDEWLAEYVAPQLTAYETPTYILIVSEGAEDIYDEHERLLEDTGRIIYNERDKSDESEEDCISAL